MREMFCPQKKVRKWERAGMRNKNKPPKQNPMRNQEKEGMKEERGKKNKPPKQNAMRNQEKEGMKEERGKKSTKRKKRTLLKISFCREALFIFYFG